MKIKCCKKQKKRYNDGGREKPAKHCGDDKNFLKEKTRNK